MNEVGIACGVLGSSLFGWMGNLADITFDDGCTIYLDDMRYESCTDIKDVCVEDGITEIA